MQSVSGCDGTLEGLSYTTAALQADCQVSAVFTPILVNVQATGTDQGSLSWTAQQLPQGEVATLTITPDAYYQIDQVSGCDGTLVGNQYTTAGLMNDCQIDVSYTPQLFQVTTRASPGGTLTPETRQLSYWDDLQLQISHDEYFYLAGIVGCDGTLDGQTYRLSNLTADCRVEAQFERQMYTVTIEVDGEGEVTPLSGKLPAGLPFEVQLTPQQNHMVAAAQGCGGELSDGAFVIPKVTQDCEIRVQFRAQNSGNSSGSGNSNSGGALTPGWALLLVMLLVFGKGWPQRRKVRSAV